MTPEKLDELLVYCGNIEQADHHDPWIEVRTLVMRALIAAARERDRLERLFVTPLLDDVTDRSDEELEFWRQDYQHASEMLERVDEFVSRAEAAEEGWREAQSHEIEALKRAEAAERDAKVLRERVRFCHGLLQDAHALLDPEKDKGGEADLVARIALELQWCDKEHPCPAKAREETDAE